MKGWQKFWQYTWIWKLLGSHITSYIIRGVILRKILVLPKVNNIFLQLNFDQITIVNYENIGVAWATWATRGVTLL